MAQYAPQATLQYSTFLKRAIVEALEAGFSTYTNTVLASTRIALDYSQKRFSLPAIIVRFQEQELKNIGVGHQEYLTSPNDPDPALPTEFIKYYHRLYKGAIQFEIWGASVVDRDLVRDAFVEVVSMTDVTPEGVSFLQRFYNDMANTPYGIWHMPVLNTDILNPGGEEAVIAPWGPEDYMVYRVTYSMPIIGEFYSNTPVSPSGTGFIEEVDVYPWIAGIDPTPTENPDSSDAPGWFHFTGWPDGVEWI